ncbi:OsmC family protein [Propionibacteriaceae bacterium Y1685]|uniref:OsmC family protein n=1 Tax=Microlunatus sp. Y1700 TaxID=3418487 RepID=UPI003B76C543
MSRDHQYALDVVWTPTTQGGTADVRRFGRQHQVSADGVGVLEGSADPTFRGDVDRWNPEQLLVASLAQCHMLTYLWLAALDGIVVTSYVDHATGTMVESGGAGQFHEVTLHPVVEVAPGTDVGAAESLHARVGEYCFIARSVNFPVRHEVQTTIAAQTPPDSREAN